MACSTTLVRPPAMLRIPVHFILDAFVKYGVLELQEYILETSYRVPEINNDHTFLCYIYKFPT